VDGATYRQRENESDRFRALIGLSQNLNLDIQLTKHKSDRLTLSTNAYLTPDAQRVYSG
jgi:hypothetical protein